MSKATVRESIIARCSAEAVFDHFGKNYQENRLADRPEAKKIELITNGPFGVGTEWHEYIMDVEGRPTKSTLRVTAYEPPFRIAYQGETAFDFDDTAKVPPSTDPAAISRYTSEILIESVGSSSRIKLSTQYDFPLKGMSKLFLPFWLGRLRELTRKRLLLVRDTLEQNAGLPKRRGVDLTPGARRWLAYWLLALVLFLIHQFRTSLGLSDDVTPLLRFMLSLMAAAGLFMIAFSAATRRT